MARGTLRSGRWALGLLTVILAASCASAPPVPRVPGEAARWLGAEPRVVVRLDAAQVKLWGEVMRGREALKAVGDRTKAVWLGFELNHLDDLKTAADTVRIVLEGDFPRYLAGLALDWNGAWKKGPAPGVWTSGGLGLSVTLPTDNLVTVRRHDETPAQPSEGVLRDLDGRAVEAAAVWISFWNPGEALFGPVGAKLLPVQRLDVVLSPATDGLEGPVVLHFSDDRSARAAAVLLKLAAAPLRSRFGQDLDWSVDGSMITGTTLHLNERDLKSLADQLVANTPPEATR